MPHGPQDALAPVLLGVTAFTAFMPHLSEVRRSTPDSQPDVGRDIRIAEIAAALVVIAGGGIIAIWSHEWYPLWIALATVLAMIALYEAVFMMPSEDVINA
jgi:fatty acid desaturase